MGIADEGGGGEFAWRGWGAEELQAGFVWGAVALALIDAFAGEDAVFPRRGAAAAAWDDVVDVAFAWLETAASVLADAAVAFPETAEGEAEAAAGHSGEAGEDEDGGSAHGTADGADWEVVFADWEGQPFCPFDWSHAIFADVETAG